MRYFKMQLGTNPRVFDVLTVADDGTMSMDCRVCERLVHYDGLTMDHTPYGDRINYGKGSSMPWTDKKGNISARWTEVLCNEATVETEAPAATVDDNAQPLPAPIGDESGVGSVTSTTAEPAEQEQPEVCPAVLSQEEDELQEQQAADPTPTPPLEWEGNGCASHPCQQREHEQQRQRRDQELQALVERELHRQLHRSSSSHRISDGQHIDPANNYNRTDESEQPATVRRKPTGHRWLKPLTLAAASVVACVVIYETGLLIPMGLIGLATSGLVK